MVFCVSPGLNVTVPLADWKSDPGLALSAPVTHCTEAGTTLALLSVSVKTAAVVPLFPSVTRISPLLIDGGASLSTMVAVVLAGAPIVAPPVAFESVTENVSLPSYTASSRIGMLMLFDASPPAGGGGRDC